MLQTQLFIYALKKLTYYWSYVRNRRWKNYLKKGLPNNYKCIILVHIIINTHIGRKYNLSVNGSNQVVDAPGDTKLLWVIREHLRLTGTNLVVV